MGPNSRFQGRKTSGKTDQLGEANNYAHGNPAWLIQTTGQEY